MDAYGILKSATIDVLNAVLTGLTAGANTAITATDTVLTALQNLQAQATDKEQTLKNDYLWKMTFNIYGVPIVTGGAMSGTLLAQRQTSVSQGVAKSIRRGSLITASAAGSVAVYHNTTNTTAAAELKAVDGSRGFELLTILIPASASYVANSRYFVGLAPSAVVTNLDYSTQTNFIGVCKLSVSDNLHICYGGTVAQTPIDLGENFPASGLSTDAYEISLKSVVYGVVNYKITRLNTGHIADGAITESTPGAGLQLANPAITLRLYWAITNNTSGGQAIIDIGTTTLISKGY